MSIIYYRNTTDSNTTKSKNGSHCNLSYNYKITDHLFSLFQTKFLPIQETCFIHDSIKLLAYHVTKINCRNEIINEWEVEFDCEYGTIRMPKRRKKIRTRWNLGRTGDGQRLTVAISRAIKFPGGWLLSFLLSIVGEGPIWPQHGCHGYIGCSCLRNGDPIIRAIIMLCYK